MHTKEFQIGIHLRKELSKAMILFLLTDDGPASEYPGGDFLKRFDAGKGCLTFEKYPTRCAPSRSTSVSK